MFFDGALGNLTIYQRLRGLLPMDQTLWLKLLKILLIVMIFIDYLSLIMNLVGNVINNWLVTDLSSLQTSYHILLNIAFNMAMSHLDFPKTGSFSDFQEAPLIIGSQAALLNDSAQVTRSLDSVV